MDKKAAYYGHFVLVMTDLSSFTLMRGGTAGMKCIDTSILCVMKQLLRYSRMKEIKKKLHVMKWALGKECNIWLYQFKCMLKSI